MMYNSSRFVQEINCPGTASLTPIRDYDNDYFHSNDNKLPVAPRDMFKKSRPSKLSLNNNLTSFKRPTSLSLADKSVCGSSKKKCSPLNVIRFDGMGQFENKPAFDNFSIDESQRSEDFKEFMADIQLLYQSELEYCNIMELANTIYRKNLNENASFKNKLVRKDSHEETLIFGNIETMSSISRLFVENLTDALLIEGFQDIDESFWEEAETNSSLQEHIANWFDVGKLLNLNFLRIKSTYLTYFVTHRKQMEFFDYMRVSNEKLFKKWYNHCYRLTDEHRLECIFERPIKRLSSWISILKSLLVKSRGNMLRVQAQDSIQNALKQYESFEKQVEREISEFNGVIKYDFSLTPIEIIQSYGVDNDHKEVLPPNITSVYDGDDPKSIKQTMRNSDKTINRSTGAASIFSGTSSRYSEYDTSTIMSSSQKMNVNTDLQFIPLLSDTTVDDLTLSDHVESFRSIHRKLVAFKKVLSRDTMISILDIYISHVEYWNNIIECDDKQQEIGNGEQGQFISSIHNEYIEKLRKLREDSAAMKVTEMQSSVKEPLATILKCCDSVKEQIHDLSLLKKDYMAFLHEKSSTTQDMKKIILATHFEKLQNKLLKELPIFLQLTYQVFTNVILNYHKLMLKYLEIASGGVTFLIRDLEILGNLKKNAGKNLDILQSYSTSRFCTKRYVRDNWFFDQDQTQSRILRRLFEL